VLPYIGEEYVHVNVRDSHDVGSYWGRSNEILWTDSDLDISSLDLDVRRYECTKQKETHLTQGEDFKAIGWYTYDYDEDNEPLEEAPKDPGEYIVKVKGTGNEYSGELNVLVEVRDPSDIGGYVAEISGNLTLGTDLSDPELSVYRVNPKTKQNEYLAKGRDFEVVGWHEYDSDETVESPTAQGDWSLVLKGKGDYKGTQYIWVDLAEPGASGGSSGGGGGSTAPTTPPATGTEVGEKAEGVVIGGGAGGDEGGSTTADVTVTGTTPATDSQGNAVDGTVSIGNISSSEGTVVIPETVTVEGKTYLVTEIPAGAMKGSETATSVTIPASVTAIGEGAFENCTSLTSVTIPAGVTEIQSSTFSGCTSLQSVEIEGDVTSIASSAFAGCESLSSVEIPATVTTIGEGAFTGCESLTSVSIPEGSTVGAGAFAGSGLTSVTIPAGVELGTRAFQDCEDLKSVTVEKGVESLPAYAFKGCTSLKSVTIKSGVTAIERSAFSGCTSLKSLTLPKGVESIGKYALYGASKVKTLTINSKDLTKASVKGSLKGSSVTTVLVPKSMVSKYAKVFSKANCGRKVVVKAIKKRG
ncbi:MAG: leucine-rich repeat domain-containing protein, partial [Coriobacteriales bacterium]